MKSGKVGNVSFWKEISSPNVKKDNKLVGTSNLDVPTL
jgi:hypothetical protein